MTEPLRPAVRRTKLPPSLPPAVAPLPEFRGGAPRFDIDGSFKDPTPEERFEEARSAVLRLDKDQMTKLWRMMIGFLPTHVTLTAAREYFKGALEIS